MRLERLVAGMISVGVLILGGDMVSGQNYPNKPIRIVTSAAGGGNDFTARLIAQVISGPLGQPVIVENRPGNITGEIVFKALPDGYTMLQAGGTFLTGPLVIKTPYDVVKDFTPVTLISTEPNIVVVTPSLPAKSVKELIALAKSRPGELNYSTGATGSDSHLAGALFMSLAGVNMVRVPYVISSQEIVDLIAGRVQLRIASVGQMAPHFKTGALRALAITSAQPSALFPGLPTVVETVPGYVSGGTTGMWVPAKTPEAIVRRLNQEIVRSLKQADVRQKLVNTGVEVIGSSQEEFAAFIKSEYTKLGKVIKDAGIRVE